MIEDNDKNKRIAKNTFYLYIRMLFSMVISLYTSRVFTTDYYSIFYR